ncbi:hypothetical protein [Flavobacterium dankookense]|uniref:Uncharacterized protein n=1 Tax=Flavobacterium dankookense TaxID=706186 RepID=A0A4V3CS15_9FLAO|nr:hypothetical protein [Flavobacterium dankookense]TDP58862.1 hypothetical protein BC748_2105 [Flavobacterium dankookense]
MQNIIELPPFYISLHRPYNQPLKTTRWVCEFLNSKKENVKSSELNINFHLYLINKLHKLYSKNTPIDYNGLNSKLAIDSVFEHLSDLSKKQKIKLILDIVRNERNEGVERQIYSTYKAASYYVNFAKEKLQLIDSKSKLTKYGTELVNLKTRGSLFDLSSSEKLFYFNRLVQNDFLLLISFCLFNKLEYKYKLKDIGGNHYDFLDKSFGIRHFNYTKTSLDNYNTVRGHWINSLGVLDKRNKIRKKYMDVIFQNPQLKTWYNEINIKLDAYESDNFKNKQNYSNLKKKFEDNYKNSLSEKKDVLGFVNLYDLKDGIKISHANFEIFLNLFYEREKSSKHIFFSNIVSSIDRRQRFVVRGVSVLKIKFKSNANK